MDEKETFKFELTITGLTEEDCDNLLNNLIIRARLKNNEATVSGGFWKVTAEEAPDEPEHD